METVVEIRCGRCNRKHDLSNGEEVVKIDGIVYGRECGAKVSAFRKQSGLKKIDLQKAVRVEYRNQQRIDSTSGMVLRGNLQLSKMIANGKLTVKKLMTYAIKADNVPEDARSAGYLGWREKTAIELVKTIK